MGDTSKASSEAAEEENYLSYEEYEEKCINFLILEYLQSTLEGGWEGTLKDILRDKQLIPTFIGANGRAADYKPSDLRSKHAFLPNITLESLVQKAIQRKKLELGMDLSNDSSISLFDCLRKNMSSSENETPNSEQ